MILHLVKNYYYHYSKYFSIYFIVIDFQISIMIDNNTNYNIQVF